MSRVIRQTSIDAYNEVRESGLLGERQKHAYEVLYEHGPLTGNELSDLMRMPGQWKRCSELKKRGLAREVGERPCRITGRHAITWDVTSSLPSRPITRDSRKARCSQLCQRLSALEQNLRSNRPVTRGVLVAEVAQIKTELRGLF